MSNIRYLIKWKDTETNEEGQGQPIYTLRTQAISMAKTMIRTNRKDGGAIKYWVEEVELEEGEREIPKTTIPPEFLFAKEDLYMEETDDTSEIG